MIRIAAIILALLVLFFLPATAAADGSGTCTFSGTVKLDNAQVADGTLVTAIIAGGEYHTGTSTGYGYSTYSLSIRAPDGKNYPDGTKVNFKVNGHTTSQTAIFKAGANVRLDLTASSGVVVSIKTWLTMLLIIVLLADVGLAGYLLFRIMVRRRKVAEPVPAVQPERIAAEPVVKYVWDKNKLAWIHVPEPATGETPHKVPVEGKTTAAKVPADRGS